MNGLFLFNDSFFNMRTCGVAFPSAQGLILHSFSELHTGTELAHVFCVQTDLCQGVVRGECSDLEGRGVNPAIVVILHKEAGVREPLYCHLSCNIIFC